MPLLVVVARLAAGHQAEPRHLALNCETEREFLIARSAASGVSVADAHHRRAALNLQTGADGVPHALFVMGNSGDEWNISQKLAVRTEERQPPLGNEAIDDDLLWDRAIVER